MPNFEHEIIASYALARPPKPAPRPRVTSRGTFNPSDYTEFKKVIASASKQIGYYTEEPLGLEIIFVFKVPKSWTKKKKLGKERFAWHDIKPDLDNLEKSIKDGMSGIVYKDDGQVSYLNTMKIYGNQDRIIVNVVKLPEIKAYGI